MTGSGDHLKLGAIVWGRTKGFPYWPAVIIAPEKAPDKVQGRGKPNQWCFRYLPYGRNEYDWGSSTDILDFKEHREEKMKQNVGKKLNESFREGIAKADKFLESGDETLLDEEDESDDDDAEQENEEEEEDKAKDAKPKKRKAKAEEDEEYSGQSDHEKEKEKEKEKRKHRKKEDNKTSKKEESEPKRRKRVIDDDDGDSKPPEKVDIESELRSLNDKVAKLGDDEKSSYEKSLQSAELLVFLLKNENSKQHEISHVSKIAGQLESNLAQYRNSVIGIQNTLKKLQAGCSDLQKMDRGNAVRIMQETGIGKNVNNLVRRSKEAGVASLAETVVKQLKEIASKPAPAAPSPVPPLSTSESRADKTEKVEKAEVKTEKAEIKTERVEVAAGSSGDVSSSSKQSARAPDDVRGKMRSLLTESFGADVTETNLTPQQCAMEIEAAIFERFWTEAQESNAPKPYTQKGRSLIFNIQRNPQLRNILLMGQMSAADLVLKDSKELAPEEMQKQRQAWADWHKAAIMPQQGNEATTDQFKCGKCGKRETKYYQLQTRSADEPMTTFVTCTFCGHRWKFC
eukprot:tig00020903_g15107.t1